MLVMAKRTKNETAIHNVQLINCGTYNLQKAEFTICARPNFNLLTMIFTISKRRNSQCTIGDICSLETAGFPIYKRRGLQISKRRSLQFTNGDISNLTNGEFADSVQTIGEHFTIVVETIVIKYVFKR